MVTDDGEIQGTVDLNTATERLGDVISCEFVGPVQVPDKPQDTTKETTTLCRSNRVRKPNRRYADTLKCCIRG